MRYWTETQVFSKVTNTSAAAAVRADTTKVLILSVNTGEVVGSTICTHTSTTPSNINQPLSATGYLSHAPGLVVGELRPGGEAQSRNVWTQSCQLHEGQQTGTGQAVQVGDARTRAEEGDLSSRGEGTGSKVQWYSTCRGV